MHHNYIFGIEAFCVDSRDSFFSSLPASLSPLCFVPFLLLSHLAPPKTQNNQIHQVSGIKRNFNIRKSITMHLYTHFSADSDFGHWMITDIDRSIDRSISSSLRSASIRKLDNRNKFIIFSSKGNQVSANASLSPMPEKKKAHEKMPCRLQKVDQFQSGKSFTKHSSHRIAVSWVKLSWRLHGKIMRSRVNSFGQSFVATKRTVRVDEKALSNGWSSKRWCIRENKKHKVGKLSRSLISEQFKCMSKILMKKKGFFFENEIKSSKRARSGTKTNQWLITFNVFFFPRQISPAA